MPLPHAFIEKFKRKNKISVLFYAKKYSATLAEEDGNSILRNLS